MRILLLPVLASVALGASLALPAAAETVVPWSAVLRQDAAWYASPEAVRIADCVLLYQQASGGWGKNVDMTQPPTDTVKADMLKGGDHGATIDNGATYTPLRFLALVHRAAPTPRYVAAFNKGLDYLTGFQYPNGGWQQFYPPREQGYWTHITYNDGAMVGVLSLLRDVANGKAPFDFVDSARRATARKAVLAGNQCLLRTQVVVRGKKTAWCQQHDETTLAPAWGRKFEPPSLCTSESVGIVRYLMDELNPSPEICAAVEAAVAWLRSARIDNLRVTRKQESGKKGAYVTAADPKAPPVWARMYEIDSNRPIFCGRDGVVKYNVADIEEERSAGYAWYGDWAQKLLDTEYPRWKASLTAR